MKFMIWGKDGGPKSKVSGFFFIEIKSLFSVVLLKFENGSRDAYHSYAFDCISWVLSGNLYERFYDNHEDTQWHCKSWRPFMTYRNTFHKVTSFGTSWVLSFRGPWAKEWREFDEGNGELYVLTHGRVKK